MSEVLSHQPVLHVDPESLGRIEHGLGFEGPGVARLPNALNESFRQALLQEISDPALVPWRDAGGTYANNRGVLIEQNHDVFALKLSDGALGPVYQVPLMLQLAAETEQFVQSLADRYPLLSSWEADEMSYHRYYDAQTGLSFHRDNMRFPGLIVVIAIDGECDFQVIDREPVAWGVDPQTGKQLVSEWQWHSTYTIPTKPGDMVLTRAPGLLPDMQPDHRPEHAVMNARVLPRISFMLRANNRPADTGYGFEYYNWPLEPSEE